MEKLLPAEGKGKELCHSLDISKIYHGVTTTPVVSIINNQGKGYYGKEKRTKK
jgi:hypothetical protein